MTYYALRVQSNREFGLRDEIKRLGLPGVEVYAPVWEKPIKWRGKPAKLKKALIPGYLFIGLPAGFLLASRPILEIEGTVGWLCEASEAEFPPPAVIREADIARIRAVEADVNRERRVRINDLIAVVDGWREGQTARIMALDGSTKRAKIQEIDPASRRDSPARPYWINLASVVPLASVVGGDAVANRAA